jgi:tetratricopeptide (TPR) repeat protein
MIYCCVLKAELKFMQRDILTLPKLFRRLGWCLLLVLAAESLSAQELTANEGTEITFQAKRLVSELENYLNTISNSDLSETDISEIIANSYSDPANRIFFDDKVIIEDDIDPAAGPKKRKDFEVSKYLRNFDLMYAKSAENTVTFSNLTTSNLKKKDFYYVKVYFDCQFSGTYRNKTSYQPRKRVATVRADMEDKKWKTYLIGIQFYTPEDAKTASLNDVSFAQGASASSKIKGRKNSQSSEANAQAMYEQDRKVRETEYKQALAQAQEAEARQDYSMALDHYKTARDISRRLEVVKKVIEIEKILEEKNNWQLLREQGDLASKRREYSKALNLYNQVLRIKPDQNDLLEKIRVLTQRLESVSLVRNLYTQGKYEEAIRECSRRLKKETDSNSGAELLLIRARSYTALEKYKNAQAEFDALISQAPDYLEARVARADLYERKGEWNNAIAEYEVILQSLAPKEPQYFAKKASLQLKVNNPKGAINDYERAIQLDLKNPLYYFERGMVCVSQADFDKALLSFNSAIRLDPSFVRGYFQRAKAYLQLNRLPEAAADFEKARQLGLDKASLEEIALISKQSYRSGLARQEQKQYDDAIRLFDQALLLKPDYAEAWFAKGEANFQKKSFAAAKENFGKAIASQSNYPEAYYFRGMAESQLEDYPTAIGDFEKAFALQPEYADALISCGRAQISQKSYSEAANTLQKAIPLLQKQVKAASRSQQNALEEKLAESHLLLGRSQYETKKYAEAIETFKTAISYNKNLSQAYYNRGMAYYETGNQTKAIEDFSTCLSKNPDRYEALYARAKAYEFSGRPEKAITDYTNVLSKSESQFKEALYRRGASYAKQKNYEAAIKDYEAYVKKYPQYVSSQVSAELGFLYLDTQRTLSALEQFKRANANDRLNTTAMYGLAFTYAQQAKVTQAIEWLEKALKANANEWKELKKDTYLANLKRNIYFNQLKRDYALK